MNKKLQSIGQKIDDIHFGLLRFHDKENRVTLEVRAKVNKDDSVRCFVADNTDLSELTNKKVNLIQKSNKDYLYIAGQAEEKIETNKIVSIRILKACWFVRKTKGPLSWLQEKHIYEFLPHDSDLELAS